MARSLTKSIGRNTQELRRPCDLYTYRRLWLAKGSRASTVVSNVDPLVLGCCDDGWTVVKLYREDDCLDAGSLFEDSDYEGHPEQGCGTATEEQDDEREDSKRETLPLPVITLGSLSR